MELSASLDTYRPNSAALFRSLSANSKSELVNNDGKYAFLTEFPTENTVSKLTKLYSLTFKSALFFCYSPNFFRMQNSTTMRKMEMFSYRKPNGEAPSKFHQTWLIPMVWARNKRLWSVVQSSTGSNAISTLYGKYINKRRFFLIWHTIEIFCDSNQKCKICRSTWIQNNSWIPIVQFHLCGKFRYVNEFID